VTFFSFLSKKQKKESHKSSQLEQFSGLFQLFFFFSLKIKKKIYFKKDRKINKNIELPESQLSHTNLKVIYIKKNT